MTINKWIGIKKLETSGVFDVQGIGNMVVCVPKLQRCNQAGW